MEIEERKITTEEYITLVLPAPGLLVILKDPGAKKSGGIIIPKNALERQLKFSASGTVVATSSLPPENDYQEKLWKAYPVGTKVGFQVTSPVMSPARSHWAFQKDKHGNKDGTVIIHVEDVVAVLFDSIGQRREYEQTLR